jgi:hypothetical protein
MPVDEELVGMLVFGALAISVAVVCHRRISSFATAVLVSGPVAALLFQVVAALHVGYVDPFFLIGLVTTTVVGWIVSSIVGFALGARRAKPAVRDPPSTRPR